MSLERTVLLVSPTPTLLKAVAPSIGRTGFRLLVAKTYQSARTQLAAVPHVLVTELKLGEYNGLHLALRSRTSGVRAIVVADKAFEHEIEQLGATWMSLEDAVSGEVPAAIDRLLQSPGPAVQPSDWYDSRERLDHGATTHADYASVVH